MRRSWLVFVVLPAAVACSNVLGYGDFSFSDGGPHGTANFDAGSVGGSNASGGSNAGGSNAAGAGGTNAAGGTNPSGGTNAAGGTNSAGGTNAAGGTNSTGGTKATGGTSSTGGTNAAGGTNSTGGTNATGGTNSTGGTGSTDPYAQARQDCVNTINKYRATLNLAPYTRWTAIESCVDGQAKADSISGTPHSAFGQCGEMAQNECPNWPSVSSTTSQCLAQMWAEGPGSNFQTHGHYLNMSSTQYTMVACGFYTTSSGSVWATQDFK